MIGQPPIALVCAQNMVPKGRLVRRDSATLRRDRTCLPNAKFVAFRIEHDRPATSVALSVLDLGGAESHEARNLILGILGGQINVHSALRRFWFGNAPEQDPPDASVVRCDQSREVIIFGG
jgi:hypothetical protein